MKQGVVRAVFVGAMVIAMVVGLGCGAVVEGDVIVSTHRDKAVLKLNSNGDILWATPVGSIVYQAVENPADKTIYAIGGGTFTKLSGAGAILLQTSISGLGMSIDVDPSDGSFYVGEWSEPNRALRKYDANGNFIKSFPYTLTSIPAVYRADGSVYVNTYGHTEGVYKFDKNGNLLWQRMPVTWWNSYGFATIVVDQRDGSVVATAQDYGLWNVGYVVRFDANGNTIWAKPIQDLDYSRNAIDAGENVVYGAAGVYGTDLYKIELTSGNVTWTKSIGSGVATPSVDASDGSIYVVKRYDKQIVKVGSNGEILWGPKDIGYDLWYLETTSGDTTPPTTTISLSGTLGNNGWYISDVQVALSAADEEGGSGVAKTEYSFNGSDWITYTAQFPVSAEGTTTVHYRSTDNAGNVEPTKTEAVNIDKTPPQVTINVPADTEYLLNQAVIADWSAEDSLSGIASAVGTVPSGQAIDTATVGAKAFNVAAIDNAGNQAEQAVTYGVCYAYSGVLPPINPDGSSVFKLGGTVPVKFQLQDGAGNYVATAIARIYVAKISDSVVGTEMEAVSTSAATTGNLFRYDSASSQYIFNLGTKTLSVGGWQIRILLDDGTSKYVTISLK